MTTVFKEFSNRLLIFVKGTDETKDILDLMFSLLISFHPDQVCPCFDYLELGIINIMSVKESKVMTTVGK